MKSGKDMKSLIKTAMLLAALTTVVKAEGVGFTSDRVVTNPLKPAATGIKNLFATEKLEMEHTVGISFGTGANRFSQYYLNTMTYKICEPLTIRSGYRTRHSAATHSLSAPAVPGSSSPRSVSCISQGRICEFSSASATHPTKAMATTLTGPATATRTTEVVRQKSGTILRSVHFYLPTPRHMT